MAGNEECKSNLHNQHLCALLEDGFDKKYPRRYEELVSNPRFVCSLCKSQAHCKENLCLPESDG